jgi:hypothetical protein
VANEVADPECRSVAQRAHKELNRVGNEGKTVPPKKKDPEAVAAALKELIAARQPTVASDEVFAVTLAYVGTLCAALQVRLGAGAGAAGWGTAGGRLWTAGLWASARAVGPRSRRPLPLACCR